MSVKLTIRERRNVFVVEAEGRLTLGEGTSALRARIGDLLEGGARRILVNMAGITYLYSSGLGELVAAYTAVTAAGGQIKLLNLTSRAHELLSITKLCTVFETFDDEASAISSFWPETSAEHEER